MTKMYEIFPQRLKDPTGTKIKVETTKLGAIHYLKQLGFTQIDMNRSMYRNLIVTS